MDNQTPFTPLQPTPIPPPAPVAPEPPVTAVAPPQAPQTVTVRRSKLPKILLILLILLLLGGVGFLGYTYKKTNDALGVKSKELSGAYVTIGTFQTILDQHEAEEDFIAKENNAEMSRHMCSGNAPMAMFDVHLNDKFAVFRYLCSEQSDPYPITIAAMKKLDDGSYEFTHGASRLAPNELPGYIFDTEPDFFGPVYGAKRN